MPAPGPRSPADAGPAAIIGAMARWDDDDGTGDEGRAPICPACGVTALPSESGDDVDRGFVCENPDCESFGDEV